MIELFEYLRLEIADVVEAREKETGFDHLKYRWDDFTVVGRVKG